MITKIRRSFTSEKKKEKVERIKVTDVIKHVLQRRSSLSEQGRMMSFLKREFPMSFERFVIDNGGNVPNIPLQLTVHVPDRKDGEVKEDETPDVFLETQAAASTLMHVGAMNDTVNDMMYNVTSTRDLPFADLERVDKAVASDIWTVLSGVFCFSGSPQYTHDDEFSEFDTTTRGNDGETKDETAEHSAVGKKPDDIKTRATTMLTNSFHMLGPDTSPPPRRTANPLHFHPRPGVDYKRDRELLSKDLCEEGQRIAKLYAGITRERGVTFNWTLKVSKDDIFIHSCDVIGSSFAALKSDCTIKKDKYTILQYLTDDEMSKSYDDSLDGYKLIEIVDDRTKIRRYFYKGIWPCSARDFVFLTTWRELDDGSILVSTISPPDEYYPDNEGFVRASIHCSGAHIRPIDPKHGTGCHITVLGHSDLKGNVPSMVINQLASSIPLKFLKKFKDLVEKAR